MNLYEELEQLNKTISKSALDQADFRFRLPRLLKKYKSPCKNCYLLEAIDCIDKGKGWVRRTIYNKKD